MKMTYSVLTTALMLAFGATNAAAAMGETPPNPVAGEWQAPSFLYN